MSWLTDTLIATGVLIALVLVLRRPVARWFGPGIAYALWALPLLRLVLPPLVLPAQPEPMTITVTAATVDFAGPLPALEAAAWPLAEIAAGLWLAGALAFLGWRVVSYRRMRGRLLEDARPVGEAANIRLVESPAVPSPVAFGITDKVIALPLGFMAGEDRTARDLAIAHELEHHAGRDIAVNFAMQPLLALHWFNPLAWLGWRALRRDQEAACDARVLAGRCAETRAAYARLIADFAQGQRFTLAAPLACPVVGEKSIIHRLRSLTMTQPTPGRRRFGRLLIGAAALALPLTATITYAASEPAAPVEKRTVKKYVIIDNPDGSTIDDASLHTRVVERNGRTIVLKTAQPVSDKEAEERIAKAEASLAEAEKMSDQWNTVDITKDEGGAAPGTKVKKVVMVRHDGHPISATQSGEHREVHTFVFDGKDGEMAEHGEHEVHVAMACDGGRVSEAEANSEKDGKKQIVKVKICSKGGETAKALTGLRQARERVADDAHISGEVREEILRELDAEIARLSKEG